MACRPLGAEGAGRLRPGRHEQSVRAAGISELQDADETVLETDGIIDPGTVRQLENRIWEHFDARHHYLRHLAPDQFGDFTDGVMRKHHSDPLALVRLLLVHRILSARKYMLLKVPLSVHEEMVRPGAVRRGRP
jgi:hypothetical protein